MKILETLRTINKKGGIGRCVFELSTELSKENEVHLLTNKFTPIPNVTPHTYSLQKWPFWFQIWFNSVQTEKYIKARRKDYDVVASHDAESRTCDVVHKHSVYVEALRKVIQIRGGTYRALKQFDPRSHMIPGIEDDVLHNSKQIIAVSKNVAADILKNYPDIPPSKITVVYNGVNINEFHPLFKEQFRYKIRQKHRIKTRDFVLMFAGCEWERKGLRHIIEALPMIQKPHTKLIVVGSGDKEEYERIAKKEGVLKKVIFAGQTQNMQRYYSASDMFIFPTEYEPFGLVITEAMASALPVITTKWAGASEIIEDGHDGLLLKQNTPEEIANLINDLTASDKVYEMGAYAREKAVEYSWQNQAKKTLEVYKKI